MSNLGKHVAVMPVATTANLTRGVELATYPEDFKPTLSGSQSDSP